MKLVKVCFNAHSQEVFAAFSEPKRAAITFIQSIIEERFDAFCYSHGYRDYKPTSGFRSTKYNTQVGGLVDSLHTFGFARDFILDTSGIDISGYYEAFRLMILKSKGCWHCYLR